MLPSVASALSLYQSADRAKSMQSRPESCSICRPLLSQVRGCWRGMNKHFAMIQSEQQIPVHEADLLAVLTERYRKSFHAV